MKLHRFFISPESVAGGEVKFSDRDILPQIKKVLRLKTGDLVLFMDGKGNEYLSEILEFGNDFLRAKINETRKNQNEPELKITLYQAVCKKDKFEWILQKGTEVGISEFAPMITERTEKLGLNRERAEKILREAAEQSERGIIPKLSGAQNFNDALQQARGEKIILDKSGENIKFYTLTPKPYTLNVFVGPEGGFTEDELKVANEQGVRIISLGPRVLRTETAGLIAAAILLNKSHT